MPGETPGPGALEMFGLSANGHQTILNYAAGGEYASALKIPLDELQRLRHEVFGPRSPLAMTIPDHGRGLRSAISNIIEFKLGAEQHAGTTMFGMDRFDIDLELTAIREARSGPDEPPTDDSSF